MRFERPVRRLTQLYAGLALFGVSMACLLRSSFGAMPWDVLHQGIAARTGLSFGTVVIASSVVVLLAWIPLRQRPGLGTVSNIVVVGIAVDAALHVMPAPIEVLPRLLLLVLGVALNAVATAAYIGVRLGPGPRDGLMTGIVGRTGWPTWAVRTSIEVVVVAAGILLGGTFGVGTVVYALTIGPLVHLLMRPLTVAPASGGGATPRAA